MKVLLQYEVDSTLGGILMVGLSALLTAKGKGLRSLRKSSTRQISCVFSHADPL